MQNIYLVKKNYANQPEGDTKPPEGDNFMKFVYHQLNILKTLVPGLITLELVKKNSLTHLKKLTTALET